MNDIQIYNGNKPFFFVSYAHRDSDKIHPYLKGLQESGYNIWFDKGIEAGTEWSNNIADHLKRCSAFLFFVSKNSVKSENCLDEVAYAKSHNKPSLLVFLDDDADLPVGTEMQTARFQRMFLTRQESVGHFVENFSQASMFDICRNQDAAPLNPEAYEVLKKTNNTKSKKTPANKKALAIGIAVGVVVVALVITIILLIIKGASNNNTYDELPSENTGGTETNSEAEQTTEKEPDVIELSDSLSDCTFRMNGIVYQLPVSFSALQKDGWTLDAGDISADTYIGGHWECGTSLVNNGNYIDVVIYNDGENAKQIRDCMIGEITASKDDISDFCIAGGVTFDSTIDDITAKVGTPSDKNDDIDDCVVLEWKFSETKNVEIFIYNDTPEYNFIRFSNFVYPEVYFKPEETPPAFLDDYISPDELGNDITSGIFSLDDVLYELPVPVREFINNGWTLCAGELELMSGESSDYVLEKNGTAIDVIIENISSKKTFFENCIITAITVHTVPNVTLILPGNITPDMTKSEINALEIDGVEKNLYNNRTCFLYDTDDEEFELTFDYDTENITEISILNRTYYDIITE